MRSWHHARTQLTCGRCGKAIEPQDRYQSIDVRGVRTRYRCEGCADGEGATEAPIVRPEPAQPAEQAVAPMVHLGRARLEEIAAKHLGQRPDVRKAASGEK